MELEFALLGLIRLHEGVTGYELNQIIKKSTGFLISTSLSRIYPALKKLHEKGLVSFNDIPLKNRPTKKVYNITPTGDAALQAWLREPVKCDLDFKPFFLKMAFSPLMDKEIILAHVDREIACREGLRSQHEPGVQMEIDYLDKIEFNRNRAELLWGGLYQLNLQAEVTRIARLKELRQVLERNLKE